MKMTQYMSTRKYTALAVLFGLALSAVVPSLGLVDATGVGSCTLSPKPGRILVQFDDKPLVSNRGQAEAESKAVDVSIPAGDYKVTLVSFDNHSDKPDQHQPNESWFVALRDASGGKVAASDAIRDLPSDIDTLTEVVNTSLRIDKGVRSAVATHAAFPADNPNSVRAVCAAFDKLDVDEDEDVPEDHDADEDHEDAEDVDDVDDVDKEGGLIKNVNKNINTVNVNVQNFFGNGDGNDDNGNGDNDKDDADAPDILDIDVRDIRDDRATLVCEVDANGADTDVFFEWSDDEDEVRDGDGEKTRTVRVSEDETRKEVRTTIDGLDEDTRYFFRCRAENDEGEDTSAIGNFRTERRDEDRNAPEVATLAATNITQTSARLNGEVDPNGEDTEAWFEWGTSPSNLNRDTDPQDAGDGTRTEDFDEVVSGLTPGVTYYFRAVAENREGIDRGSVRSFRAVAPVVPTVLPAVTQVITRVVEVAREEEKEVDALIVTLEADRVDVREVAYTVSYENRTDDTFTNAVLTVELPRELAFVDADPREDSERNGELTFEIGTIRPGDEDSFLIGTEVDEDVDRDESIVFTASVEYIDAGKTKIVRVIDESTLGDIERNGGFLAGLFGSLGDFFTNPFFWFLVLLLLIFLVYRYFALLARPKEERVVIRETASPMQRPLPNGS